MPAIPYGTPSNPYGSYQCQRCGEAVTYMGRPSHRCACPECGVIVAGSESHTCDLDDAAHAEAEKDLKNPDSVATLLHEWGKSMARQRESAELDRRLEDWLREHDR